MSVELSGCLLKAGVKEDVLIKLIEDEVKITSAIIISLYISICPVYRYIGYINIYIYIIYIYI